MGRNANRNSNEHTAALSAIDTALIARRASMDAAVSPTTPGGGVQGGRMTKLTHYGRMRSVTARALRLADPRAAAAALQTAAATNASHQRSAVMGADDAGGVSQFHHHASRRFARRRGSTGSVPTGLSRPASGEWGGGGGGSGLAAHRVSLEA
ncbi:hypothetical protein GGF44_006505, partial [Coemansia sp. RSA 1694]